MILIDVIIPAFNEEEALPAVLRELRASRVRDGILGTFRFDGAATDLKASGTFKFIPNATFKKQVEKMGYRKLSARPRHHTQAAGAIGGLVPLVMGLAGLLTGEGTASIGTWGAAFTVIRLSEPA